MIIHLEYMFVNHKYMINVYLYMFTISLLITPQQKRKSPVKSLATIGGALHSLLGFLFAVSSRKRKKITRLHHQNCYSLILLVTIPYLLLS